MCLINIYLGNLKKQDINLIDDNNIKNKIEHIHDEQERYLKISTYISILDCIKKIDPSLKLKFDELGKPNIIGNKSPLYISISHSVDKYAFALASINIGIDIEKKRNFSNDELLRLSNKCLTEDEMKRFKLDNNSFIKLWTIKESYVKLLGTGFSIFPKQINVSSNVSTHSYQSSNYQTIDLDDYILSIASFDNVNYKINNI